MLRPCARDSVGCSAPYSSLACDMVNESCRFEVPLLHLPRRRRAGSCRRPKCGTSERARRGARVDRVKEINSRILGVRRLVPELLFIAVALGLPFGLGTAPSIFRDGDVSWQVAAGRWILQHGRIPATDPFSYTVFGHRWVAMEWLAQIVYGGAFAIDGYAGLATAAAAAVILLFTILYFYLERRASPIAVTVALLMVAFVVAPFI